MEKFWQNFKALNLDPEPMNFRLKRRLSLGEFLGLLVCLSMLGIFIWLFATSSQRPPDFQVLFVDARSHPGFYYTYWILPVMDNLKQLPMLGAYALWDLIGILSCFFAVRVFGGKPLLVLLSYQILSMLYYGNISGILVGGFALCWWGMAHHKWVIAGLGITIALTKYQVGLPMGILLIWYSGIHWKNIIRIMFVPMLFGIVSLFLYPFWPLEVISKLNGFPYIPLGITFWNYFGAWSLLLWLPAILLPLPKPQRFLALFSLSTFAVPYLLQFDLLTLMSFPIGLLPLLGFVGFLFPFVDKIAIRMTALLPFVCYFNCNFLD